MASSRGFGSTRQRGKEGCRLKAEIHPEIWFVYFAFFAVWNPSRIAAFVQSVSNLCVLASSVSARLRRDEWRFKFPTNIVRRLLEILRIIPPFEFENRAVLCGRPSFRTDTVTAGFRTQCALVAAK